MNENCLAEVFPHITASALRLTGLTPAFSRVIDLGGGDGTWVKQLLESGFSYAALLDIDPGKTAAGFELLRSSFSSERWSVMTADVTSIPCVTESFDLAVCRSSLHFWNDLPCAIREIARILKPGGWFFSGRGFGPDTPEEIRDRAKQKKRSKMCGYDEAGSCSEKPSMSPEELSAVINSCGFVTEKIMPEHKTFWILARRL